MLCTKIPASWPVWLSGEWTQTGCKGRASICQEKAECKTFAQALSVWSRSYSWNGGLCVTVASDLIKYGSRNCSAGWVRIESPSGSWLIYLFPFFLWSRSTSYLLNSRREYFFVAPLFLTSSPIFLSSSLDIEPWENISDRRSVGITLIRRASGQSYRFCPQGAVAENQEKFWKKKR